jgi:hypothetical protein
MSLCKYRYILGVPGEGIHKYKFLGTSIVDYIGTIVLAMILTKFTKIPLVLATIGMFALGILLHMLFCLRTGTETWLFGG